MKEKITDLNAFISSIQIKDEADFYIEICDFFGFRNLREFFDLNDLIDAYRECIDAIKNNSSDPRRVCVFIKNITENRKYNEVQRYNFYLLLHIFFDYLLFDENIKKDTEHYNGWIEDQLDIVNEGAAKYYYYFNISDLMKSISNKSANEQIAEINIRKKDYLVALNKDNIPANNFDYQCDEQIKLINDLILVGHDFTLEPKTKEIPEAIKDEMIDSVKGTRPQLALPVNLQNDKYGGTEFAAKHTGYSKNYIRTLANKREIPCYKPTKTGHYRFFAKELDDWKVNGMKNFQNKPDDKLIGKQPKK